MSEGPPSQAWGRRLRSDTRAPWTGGSRCRSPFVPPSSRAGVARPQRHPVRHRDRRRCRRAAARPTRSSRPGCRRARPANPGRGRAFGRAPSARNRTGLPRSATTSTSGWSSSRSVARNALRIPASRRLSSAGSSVVLAATAAALSAATVRMKACRSLLLSDDRRRGTPAALAVCGGRGKGCLQTDDVVVLRALRRFEVAPQRPRPRQSPRCPAERASLRTASRTTVSTRARRDSPVERGVVGAALDEGGDHGLLLGKLGAEALRPPTGDRRMRSGTTGGPRPHP